MKLILFLLISISACAQTKFYRAMEVNYVILQAADVHSTKMVLNRGGVELNPIARWMIDRDLLLPGKIIATSAFLLINRSIYRDHPKLATCILLAGNLAYGYIAGRNYSIAVRLRIAN